MIDNPKIRRVVKPLLAVMIATLFFAQTEIVRRAALIARRLMESPVQYEKLVPDKQTYKPGESARFTYVRHSKVSKSTLVLLSRDFLENITTKETFDGAVGIGTVKNNGDETIEIVRRIPEKATPGKYTLVGILSVQADELSKVETYFSDEFEITDTASTKSPPKIDSKEAGPMLPPLTPSKPSPPPQVNPEEKPR